MPSNSQNTPLASSYMPQRTAEPFHDTATTFGSIPKSAAPPGIPASNPSFSNPAPKLLITNVVSFVMDETVYGVL